MAKLRAEVAAHGLSETAKKTDLYCRFTEVLEREGAAVPILDCQEIALGDDIEAVVYECFTYDDLEVLITLPRRPSRPVRSRKSSRLPIARK